MPGWNWVRVPCPESTQAVRRPDRGEVNASGLAASNISTCVSSERPGLNRLVDSALIFGLGRIPDGPARRELVWIALQGRVELGHLRTVLADRNSS